MKQILISAFSLLFALSSFAQVDRSVMPEPGPAPKIDLGKTQSFTLDNGLKVFVVENHKLPKVTFSLQLDIDGIKEGNKAGASELAGDLMRKGTENKTMDEIDFGIDFIGARLSTSAYGVYASSLVKHQETLLEIMADIVKTPKFPEEELEKLKTQYKASVKSQLNEPDAIASNVRRVLLYGKDHPYGEVMTEETIDNITLDDVKAYYTTYYRPNIAYLAVVGDIKFEEAKSLITKYFKDWEKAEVPTTEFPTPEVPENIQVAFVHKPGAVQSVIMTFNTIELLPGSKDVIPASIANMILGGGFTSKLNLNLREKHAYTYGARSSLSSDKIIGNFYSTAKVRNEVTDSAITQTLLELINMRDGKITEEELTTIKNYRVGTFAYSLENPQTKARFAISIDKNDLPKDYYETYLEKVAAVTLEDVKEVSKKYFNPFNGYILVVGDKNEIADKIAKFSPTKEIVYYDAYGNEVTESEMKEAPDGVTAQSVLEDYIQAIGGQKNLKKVKSLKSIYATSIQGMPIDVEVYNGKSGQYLSIMSSSGMQLQKQVFDGSKGQVVQMTMTGQMETVDMDEKQVKGIKDESLIFPELVYTSGTYKIELQGVTNLKGEDVYVIDVQKPSGSVQTNYYSVKSKYLVKSITTFESEMGNVFQESVYSDYKKIGKVYVPYHLNQTVGPNEMDLELKTIEINPKLSNDLFELE